MQKLRWIPFLSLMLILGCSKGDMDSAVSELESARSKAKDAGFPMTAEDIKASLPKGPDSGKLLDDLSKSKILTNLNVAVKAKTTSTFVRGNSAAYATVEQAAKGAIALPSGNWNDTNSIAFSEIGNLRTASKLLQVRAMERARQGDVDGAIADLERMRNLTPQASRVPFFIATLVAIAIDAIRTVTIQNVAAIWAEKPDRLQRLKSVVDQPEPIDLYTSMRGEAFFYIALLRNVDLYGGWDAFAKRMEAFDLKPVEPTGTIRTEGDPPGAREKAFLARGFQVYGDLLTKLKASSGDIKQQDAVLKEVIGNLGKQKGPSYAALQITLPSFESGGAAAKRATSMQALSHAYIELLLQRKSKGLPDVLQGKTFTDPITDQRFGYRKTRGGFRIWAWGTNGVDDGGVTALEARASSTVPGAPPAGHDDVFEFPLPTK